MRRPLIALTIALAALTAGCSYASPGWTYAPPTPAASGQPAASGDASSAPSAAASAAGSAAPSGGASAAPSGGGSAAPSAAGSAGPSAAPSDSGGQGGGSQVAISALNIGFEQKEVTAPADQPFTITFDNKDAGIPHNIEIKDANNQSVFKGAIVNGPAQAAYTVGALTPGAYQFVCSVHPNMTGTLKVGG